MRRVVYVVGPGRSGTSTAAGALALSGLAVPGEPVGANDRNPAGFHEPRWVVELHRRLLRRALVGTVDTDPGAYDRVQDSLGPRDRVLLRDWLGQQLELHPSLVVKDPRGVWFTDLWRDVADELGVPIGYLTMLRHPAEVAGSRETYYGREAPGRSEIELDVARIAGLVNVFLTAERITRGAPRSFVRYTDVLTDWRPVLERLSSHLDLTLDPPPCARPHPVDAFIDPSLRRVRNGWADLELPGELQELAERTWRVLTALAEDPEAPSALAEADRVREQYEVMTQWTRALNRQALRRLQADARRGSRRRGRSGRARARFTAASLDPRPTAVRARVAGAPAWARRALVRVTGRR